MKIRTIPLLLCVLAACTPASDDAPADDAPAPDPRPVVVLETTAGRIVMELDRTRAPESVDNFLLHVNSGFYDGLIFHRIAENFVVQTGRVDSLLRRRATSVFPIANEASNGLSNTRGAVAMARTSDPHSATSEFFINLKDNRTRLDFRDSTVADWGYAVFGTVTGGLDVLDAIAAPGIRPRRRFPEFPAEPVTITRAFVQE